MLRISQTTILVIAPSLKALQGNIFSIVQGVRYFLCEIYQISKI